MNQSLDTKRIAIFLVFAFGIAWAAALALYLTGGFVDSPVLHEESGLTLSTLLVSVVFTFAPALANVFTRLVTREGWSNLGLSLNFVNGWRYLIMGWVGPTLLIALGTLIFFVVLPRFYDANLTPLRTMFPDEPYTASLIWGGLLVFGDEFGWRAYLQDKLMPLGGRRAVIIVSLVWGVWLWPIIAQGHIYGLDYTGAPWLALPLITLYALATGTVFSWLTIKDRSIWPAIVAHAALNNLSGLGAALLQGETPTLLGPFPTGIVVMSVWIIAALVIFVHPRGLVAPEPKAEE